MTQIIMTITINHIKNENEAVNENWRNNMYTNQNNETHNNNTNFRAAANQKSKT
jgi:hypothetical protein